MAYQNSKLNEADNKSVRLDNEDISVQDFNRKLESLKPGQRIIETSEKNFHIVERIRG